MKVRRFQFTDCPSLSVTVFCVNWADRHFPKLDEVRDPTRIAQMTRKFAILLTFCSVLLHGSLMAARVELVAGGGNNPDGGRAEEARLNGPFGVDFDRSGNMYIIEMPGNRLWR